MDGHFLDFINLVNVGCWCLCFWWMHRISARQDAVLEELAQQTRRIASISKEEHAILTELHPNVEAIQHGVEEVSEKVKTVEGRVAR
jgi:hypothetical protein